MLKTLASISTLLFLLCAPALADGPALSPAPVQVGFAISSGAPPSARHYGMKLFGDSCGRAGGKTAARSEDAISLCVHDGAELRLEIDWQTREGQHDVYNKSTVLAKRGTTFDLQSDGVTLTIEVR